MAEITKLMAPLHHCCTFLLSKLGQTLRPITYSKLFKLSLAWAFSLDSVRQVFQHLCGRSGDEDYEFMCI